MYNTFKLFATIIFTTMTIFSAHAQGIVFSSGTFDETVNQAIQENKLIFIDCYTEWCGPCKMLANSVFTNDTVGEFFNRNFINLKINMEKSEGETLGKMYPVNCYPTLFFIHPKSQKIVHKVTGAKRSAQWLIDEAQKALDPEHNLLGLAAAYQNDKYDTDVVKNYLFALDAAAMNQLRDSVLTDYLGGVNEEERYNAANWQIVSSLLKDPYSFVFTYLLKHANGFVTTVGADVVNKKIDDVYRYAVMQFIRRVRVPENQFPNERFHRLQIMLNEYTGKNAGYFRAQMNMVAFVQAGNYAGMIHNMKEADEHGILSDPFLRFHFIWLNLTYLCECKDKNCIKQGLIWLDTLKPDESDTQMQHSWMMMKERLNAAGEE